jgi:hypothetical protein
LRITGQPQSRRVRRNPAGMAHSGSRSGCWRLLCPRVGLRCQGSQSGMLVCGCARFDRGRCGSCTSVSHSKSSTGLLKVGRKRMIIDLHEGEHETRDDRYKVREDSYCICHTTVFVDISSARREKVQNAQSEDESNSAEYVRPDIDRLIVDAEGALQGAEVGECCPSGVLISHHLYHKIYITHRWPLSIYSLSCCHGTATRLSGNRVASSRFNSRRSSHTTSSL